MPEVMAELGRGSPTGVMRSRPGRVTNRFGQGAFVLDWTFGRVLFVRDSGGWENVAVPRGSAGFAVTDIDATSDGRVVVSVGGRRSRGGIYLIDVEGTAPNPVKDEPIGSGPQPPAEIDTAEIDTADSDAVESDAAELDTTVRWIARLRQQPERRIDHAAAEHAINALNRGDATREQCIAASILLIESVGGLGAGDAKDPRGEFQAAAVFDSCRSILRPRLKPGLLRRATDVLIDRINQGTGDTELTNELIRALAVLEPDSQQAFDCVLSDLYRVTSPTDKLHRLIALARLPVKRSDAMTDQTAAAMLQIPRMIEDSQTRVDRNWTPRLGELFVALEHRDSLLPSRLVATPDFGSVADLVWTVRMDPENLERARQRLLAGNDEALINPQIARFIARGDDVVPPAVIRRWLSSTETRPAGWLAVASHARISDIETLREAALSVDVEAREAATAALARLGEPVPSRVSNSRKIQDWLERAAAITRIEADASRGKGWFEQRQCANCHNGATALGPSLEGVSKRFGPIDLFRATVDPSHTISDRYLAKQVVTVDGDIITGMAIYESVDGVTLMTADTKMKRINTEDIDQMRDSAISLMPEGLLEGMSDNQVAELLAYLRSL
jgi:putative heme-binding domain-containing protein